MNTDIRESYRVFPEWTNPFWTWLTGKPRGGERPKFVMGPWGFMLCSLGSFAFGITLAIAGACSASSWRIAVVLTGYGLAVSGSRRLVSTVVHQCIHARFSSSRAVDRFVGEALTLLTFTQTAEEYRHEHFVQHHRYGVFTTEKDPAAQFLESIGFAPGMSMKSLWRRLFVNFLSPQFQGIFLLARIKSNFVAAPWPRKLAAYAHLSLWVGAGHVLGPQAVLVGFAVPVILLYQLSVMLEFISEHAWFVPPSDLRRAKDIHRTHSWGRFCGTVVPRYRRDKGWTSFLGESLVWGLLHVFYHLPVRLLILPGDLPQHDFHHRHPSTTEWTQAAYAREADLPTAGREGIPYGEFWGLHRAIEHVFQGLTAARTDAAYRTAPDDVSLSQGDEI